MSGWEGLFIGNCAKDESFVICTNGMRTHQYQAERMRRINFTGILKYKQITESWAEDQTFLMFISKGKELTIQEILPF